MKNHILVPVTPSMISQDLVRIADEWGNLTGTTLKFVHVVKPGAEEKDRVALIDYINQLGITSHFLVESHSGEASKVILEQEEKDHPDFILMSAHSHTLLKRLLLGSVSEYVLNYCRGSICLYKKQKKKPQNRIIVPVNYDKVNEAVISLADRYALQSGAKLYFVHSLVLPVDAMVNLDYVWEIDPKEKDDRRESDRIRNISGEESDRLKNYLSLRDIKSPYEQRLEFGKPYLHILELQEEIEARLIMMPLHSYRMENRRLPGSVTRYVLQKGCSSVFVYKEI